MDSTDHPPHWCSLQPLPSSTEADPKLDHVDVQTPSAPPNAILFMEENPANQLRLVVYSMIHKDLYICGAGFLPSTVGSSWLSGGDIPFFSKYSPGN